MRRALLLGLVVTGLLIGGIVPGLSGLGHSKAAGGPTPQVLDIAVQAQNNAVLYRVCVSSPSQPVAGVITIRTGRSDSIDLHESGYSCGPANTYRLEGSYAPGATGQETIYALDTLCVSNPFGVSCLSRDAAFAGANNLPVRLGSDCYVDFTADSSGMVTDPISLRGCRNVREDISLSSTGVAPTATPGSSLFPCLTPTVGAATVTSTAVPSVTNTSTPLPTNTPTTAPTATSTSTPSPTGTSTMQPLPGIVDTATKQALPGAVTTGGSGNGRTATRFSTSRAAADDATAAPTTTVDNSCAATSTPATTATGTSVPTATATGTSVPTATATGTSVPTATATGTSVPATTATGTSVSAATATGTSFPRTTTVTPTSGVITVPATVVIVIATPTSGLSPLPQGFGTPAATKPPFPGATVVATKPPFPAGLSEQRLGVDIAPKTLRPGDSFQVRMRYLGRSLVTATLGYAPHYHMTLTRRSDQKGMLTISMRMPVVTLSHGHGIATLTVLAVSGSHKASQSTRLALSSMILSASGAKMGGCIQVFTVRVAYLAKGNAQLTAAYPGHKPYDTVRLRLDGHGMATEHVGLSYVSTGSRSVTALITVSGQRGSSRQTEQVRIGGIAPKACLHSKPTR